METKNVQSVPGLLANIIAMELLIIYRGVDTEEK